MRKRVDEEMQNLQLDKMEVKKGKTSEQIRRHSVDVSIESKPIEKALYLLAKGDEVQKLSVVENLPQLMNVDTYAAFNKIIPKIQQELTRASSEFSVTTSRVFQVLIESHFRTDINITSIVLQSLDSKDPLVANAWLETLLEVILVLPIRIIQTEILPLAVQKGQCSQPTSARVVSCKILGKVVLHQHMKALEIKKDVLPVVYSLCQDVNYTVRATICEQLPAIAKGLGATMVKNFLLSNLVELASDDNVNVRAVAVSSVVQTLTYLDKETKTSTMVPLIMNLFITQPKLEEASAVVLAKNMGLLLTSLENSLNLQQADSLINFYQHLAKRGLDAKDLSVYNVDTSQDVKGREHCANNFPAVMQFALNMSPGNVNKLYEIFKSLTFDSCYLVRRTIGGIFHEVARILGPKNSIMKTEFVRLLRDEAEEVLNMLVPHVSTTLMLFMTYGTLSIDRADSVSSEISKALLKCFAQLLKGYNWRLSSMFLKQLESLPMVFKSEQIHNEFTPLIVRSAVHGRAKPVRSQAVRTLLFFMRYNPKLIQRTWLRDHLIHELAENKCCYTRHVFIDLCKHAMELFSNKFFKENFFTPLLRMGSDKVSTIRYSIVNLLPKLRVMIHLPQDRKLLTSFEQVVITIEKNEKDRDVLAHLVSKTKEMISLAQGVNVEDAKEKKLVEEEENVAKGKIIYNYMPTLEAAQGPKPQMLSRPSRSQSMSREVPRPASVGPAETPKIGGVGASLTARSTSVPRSAPITSTHAREMRLTQPLPGAAITDKGNSSWVIQRAPAGDMTFLKQHFYIDAGVNLPIEETNLIKKSDSNTSIDKSVSLENLENSSIIEPTSIPDEISDNLSNLSVESNDCSSDNSSVNMTDDVKVNMRRKRSDRTKRFSHSEIPTAIHNSNIKNKRHSSVYTDASVANISANTAANKRRSLNIQTKELSKIPVILKSVENVPINKNDETKGTKKGANSSNLPVLVRFNQQSLNK